MKRWLKGLEHKKGIPLLICPRWEVQLVLKLLNVQDLEPMGMCKLKCLTLKTVFLLALAKRVSELHILRCDEPFTLFFRDYVPTALSGVPTNGSDTSFN